MTNTNLKSDKVRKLHIPQYISLPENIFLSNLFDNYDPKRYANQLEEMYKPFIKDISEKTVLDLGCGFGTPFVSMLKQKGYTPKLIHIDIDSEVFLRENSSIAGKRIVERGMNERFYDWKNDLRIVGDATNMPLKDNSIDIVHQNMVFAGGSFGDREGSAEKVCEEVYRILRMSGLYILNDLTLELEFMMENNKFKRLLWEYDTPDCDNRIYQKI